MLEPSRVVTRLELAPTRRTRRTAAAAIVGARAWSTGPAIIAPAVEIVALAAQAWHPISCVRSTPAIVVIVTAAVVAPPSVHPTAVAVAPTTCQTPETGVPRRDDGVPTRLQQTNLCDRQQDVGVELGERTRIIRRSQCAFVGDNR